MALPRFAPCVLDHLQRDVFGAAKTECNERGVGLFAEEGGVRAPGSTSMTTWRAVPLSSVTVSTPGSTMCRVLMPVRWRIHSSVVSNTFSKSAFVTTFGGT